MELRGGWVLGGWVLVGGVVVATRERVGVGELRGGGGVSLGVELDVDFFFSGFGKGWRMAK